MFDVNRDYLYSVEVFGLFWAAQSVLPLFLLNRLDRLRIAFDGVTSAQGWRNCVD
jgi:hypothetical protein